MHTDDLVRAGLTPTEARRQALIRLGGAEQTRQAHRERRTLPWIESLLRDLTYAARTLAKHRGTTAIAILSIGLGIGANATIFSMVSRFVLRPAPMGDPTTLLALHTTHDGDRCCNPFSWPLYNQLRSDAKSFSGVAAYYELIPSSITGQSNPERVWGQGVSSNFFSVAQLPMQLGRGFVHGDENAPVVVLGSALWHRQFNADPRIIGKPITLSGHSYTVVGVVSPAFHGADQILYTEFWVPMSNVARLVPNLPNQESLESHWVEVLARLAPGVTRKEAGAELKTLTDHYALAFPKTENNGSIVFEQAGSLPSNVRANVVLFFAALSIVVLLVLSIAATNVANLLFAQAAPRQRDMAVRLAMGASAARLRRQLLVESLLMGLGGGCLGILLSLVADAALSSSQLPAPVPLDIQIGVDWRVLVYTLLLSIVSGTLLGVAPAWAASRPKLINALKGEDALARPGRRFTMRNLLVVVQIAMSVILLCITGLFLRSLQSASSINIGFRPKNILLASIDPRVDGYTAERTQQFIAMLRRQIAAIPGVDSVAVTDVAPLTDGNRSESFVAPGHTPTNSSGAGADLYMVTPDYFETLGIPRVSDSDFGSGGATGPRTAIVNRAFVDAVFGGENPLGQQVIGGGTTYQVIGVADNSKSRSLGEETRPILYRSLDRSIAEDPSLMGYTLLIHTVVDPNSVRDTVRRQIQSLDPTLAIYNEETMDEHVRTAYFLPRLAAELFGTFGFIGLVLAAVGLYSVMSYSVSRRTREIGIRMALGAQPGTVERLILRQGMVLTLIALVLGWPAAWMLAKMASSFLYGIQPNDALTFALVPPFLAVIALVACYIPARRAAAVDPMRALRAE